MKQPFCSTFLLALPLVLVSQALAQTPPPEPPKRPWSDQAELSIVNTTGNAESTNFAFSNKYVYTWSHSDVTVNAAALRTETTTIDTSLFPTVTETEQVTAESYLLDGKYRHDITQRFLWYGMARWYRNRPSGIDSREFAGAGIGYKFIASDVQSLTGELGVDYTREEQVGAPDSDSYAGARGFLGYERKLSPTSKFNAELELLDNLDDSDDWRGSGLVSVTASISSKLALKASYRALYDHQPVVLANGYEFKTTDTIFTASLVVNF